MRVRQVFPGKRDRTMSDYLFDLLTIVGLVTMVAALYLGIGWLGVMWFGGLVAAVAGVVGAWRAAHADRTG